MRRGRQVTRLFALAQLVGRPQGVSIAEAADLLECMRRTVYRDLEALQASGYPLRSEPEDGGVRWRLMERFRRQHRLPLTHEELAALWVARESFQALDATVFAFGARSLLDKVREALSGEVRFPARSHAGGSGGEPRGAGLKLNLGCHRGNHRSPLTGGVQYLPRRHT